MAKRPNGRLKRSVMGSNRPKSLGHFVPIKAKYQNAVDGIQVDVLRSEYHEKFPDGATDQHFFTELEDYIAGTTVLVVI